MCRDAWDVPAEFMHLKVPRAQHIQTFQRSQSQQGQFESTHQAVRSFNTHFDFEFSRIAPQKIWEAFVNSPDLRMHGLGPETPGFDEFDAAQNQYR